VRRDDDGAQRRLQEVRDLRVDVGVLVGWTRRAAIGGATALAAGAGAWALRSRPHGPNVVLILSDDQGYDDLGCVSGPGQERTAGLRTPRLDRMAAEGLRLTDFSVAAPVCTPSRAALLTGCYPPRVGFGAIGGAEDPGVLGPRDDVGLDPAEHTIADLMRQAGRATGMVGKWHLGCRPELLPTRQGFDAFFGVPYSHNQRPLPLLRDERVLRWLPDEPELTGVWTEAALTFLQGHRDRPFFLYLAYTAPHAPFNDRNWPHGTGHPYADALARMDEGIGVVLDRLDDLGLSERTLVWFLSDNGPWLDGTGAAGRSAPFRGGKGETTEGGIRSPCLLRWPGILPAGTVLSEMVTSLDVLPTLGRLVGAETPPRAIDGLDVWDTLASGAPTPRTSFASYARGRLEAIRSGPWKRAFAVPMRTPPVPAALYHLGDDPAERIDRSAEHRDEVARLEALAEPIRRACGDALRGVEGEEVRPLGKA
jgi:arylsulfatase